MSDSALEQRIGKLLLIMLNMNRNIIEIHTALQEVSNVIEDEDAKTKILHQIGESQARMSETLERVEEYFKLAGIS